MVSRSLDSAVVKYRIESWGIAEGSFLLHLETQIVLVLPTVERIWLFVGHIGAGTHFSERCE
jgi:hypothetical protein